MPPAFDPTLRLSSHFSLGEFCYSDTARERGVLNVLPMELLPRAIATARMLEGLREALGGRPVRINSGYRCRALNELVGGSPRSDHMNGDAADIVVPGFGEAYNVAMALAPLVSVLGIGQLILEGLRGSRWVHVSTHAPELPINRILTISRAAPRGVPGIHPVE